MMDIKDAIKINIGGNIPKPCWILKHLFSKDDKTKVIIKCGTYHNGT